MSIFTEEAKKEIKRFLPHYIVASGFISLSVIIGGLANHVIIQNLQQNSFNNNPPTQQQVGGPNNMDFEEVGGLLPSEYKIGIPYEEGMKDVTKPLVVEFYADWCPHCKRITPMFAEISEKINGVNFATVDTQKSENNPLSKKYNIDKFPYLMIIDTKTGTTKEIPLDETTSTTEGLQQKIETLLVDFK